MHNTYIESHRKCRRLFYAKVDFPTAPAGEDGVVPLRLAGEVLGVASGGGALEELTGDDLIIATFNDYTAPQRIGCIEEFYNPFPANKPLQIDLAQVQVCQDAVVAHKVAVQMEKDFVFEKGIRILGSEQPTTDALRHGLKVQEVYTRDKPDRTSDHDTIIQAQTELEALCKTCEDCCEQLLVTRDNAISFETGDN